MRGTRTRTGIPAGNASWVVSVIRLISLFPPDPQTTLAGPTYEPRRPDFDDVEGGFTLGATLAGFGCFSCGVSRLTRNADFGPFDEKSGMPRGDFFFKASPGRMQL
jgi:hypothetical protein